MELFNKIKSYMAPKEIILFCIGLLLLIHSYPNTYFYSAYFAWIALVPLFLILQNKSYKQVFVISYLFWLIMFSSILHLNSSTFLIADSIILWICIFVLAVLLPLSYILPIMLSVFLSKNLPYYYAPFIYASVWVLAEYAIIHSPVSFPISIAITQFNQPYIIQIANLTGFYGVAFLIVFCNSSIILIYDFFSNKKLIPALQTASVLLILVSFCLLYGIYQINLKERDIGQHLNVTVIQPNISIEKGIFAAMNNGIYEDIVSELKDMTKVANTVHGNLVIWPELALNRYVVQTPSLYKKALPDLFSDNKLIFGALHYLYDSKQAMNSAYLYDNNAGILSQYDKNQLVPLYESRNYAHGKEIKPMPFDMSNSIGTMICVESVHPDIAREMTRQNASLLVLLSNDSLFGNTNWPVLHAALLPFRAVENNRWAIHAGNTGPSLIIDNTGFIMQASPMLSKSIISDKIEFIHKKTFYTNFGDVFVMVCMITTGIIFIAQGVRYKSKKYDF